MITRRPDLIPVQRVVTRAQDAGGDPHLEIAEAEF